MRWTVHLPILFGDGAGQGHSVLVGPSGLNGDRSGFPPDFTVSLSSTNVLASQSDRILVTLDTGLVLASVSFLLDFSSARLQDLTVQPLISELSNVTLSPDGPMRYRVRLTAAAGRVLQWNRVIAGLDFNLGLNLHSEVL